MGDWPRH